MNALLSKLPRPLRATCNDDSEEANSIYAGDILVATMCGEDDIRRLLNKGKVEKPGSTHGPDSLDMVDALSRLFAASFDLLEASADALRCLEDSQPTEGGRTWQVCEQLRAAISKANGDA